MKPNITQKLMFSVFAILVATTGFSQFVVTNGSDAGAGSLRDAIGQANITAGANTITFSGNFIVSLTSGEIEVTEDLAIAGNGTTGTIVDGASNSGRLLNFTGGTTSSITMMAFRNASSVDDGGAIALSNAGVVTISNSLFTNNTAAGSGGGGAISSAATNLTLSSISFIQNTATGMGGSGGAIYQATSGTLAVIDSQFSENTAIRAGGAIEVDSNGNITFNNTIFDNNEAGAAPGNGGAFHITGGADSTITGGLVANNIATNEGGGFWNGSGTMIIANVTFENNSANGDDSGASGGGAIFNEGGDITIDADSRIEGNFAIAGASGSGGGVLVAGGSFTASGTEIIDNVANRAGGAIEVRNGADGAPATLNLTNVTMTGNLAGIAPATAAPGNGGGVHISGPSDTNISGGDFTNNIAANEGGALWNGSGTMVVSESNISNNAANGDDSGASGGGGIFNEGGDLTTNNNTIIDSNEATAGASGSGGGVLVAGGTYVASATIITNNLANRAGGGIEVRNALSDDSPASVTLASITLNNNNAGAAAPAPGNGGGLHVTGPSNTTLWMGTVSNNSAANEGGGLWNGSGQMAITEITIDSNVANGDDSGASGGGGIFNEGGALITGTETVITNNEATAGASGSGGGILVAGGSYLGEDTVITGNSANRAGGGIEVRNALNDDSPATLTLINVTLDENSAGAAAPAPGNGGAIHISGPSATTMTGGTVNNNTAANEGGGLWNGSGIMSVTGTTIDSNTADGDDMGASGGGGIFNEGGELITGEDTMITNNEAIVGASGSGGGLLIAGGSYSATGTTITNNVSNRAGGGIEVRNALDDSPATISIINSTINNNLTGIMPGTAAPGNGGGIHISGPSNTTVLNSDFSMNQAANEGGGLWNGSGTMTITDTSIDLNSASGDDAGASGGGGIFNEGGVLSTYGTTSITNNSATGASGSGGGVLVAGGSFTATGTSIVSNEALRAGGGIEVRNALSDNSPATLILTDIDLSSNNAGVDGPAPGNGGGLHISGPSTTQISGSTVNDNIAANEGGGLWNGSGAMSVAATTIDNNQANGDDSGASGGGGIFNEGGALTSDADTVISNNSATQGASGSGGGVLVAGGSYDATGTVFTSNLTNRAGGAIEVRNGADDSPASLSLTDVTMQLNNAGSSTPAPGNGGGIHITGPSDTTITGGDFNSNVAANEGGALWNGSGTMNITGATIDANTANGDDSGASGGGGIFNEGGVLVTDADTFITNNAALEGASGSGGGILVAGGSYTAIGTSFSSNEANRAGGAIEVRNRLSDDTPAELNLTGVIFDGNFTGINGMAAPGNGGAIHISGPSNVTLTDAVATGNEAANEGGAYWNGSGVMAISNSQMDANSANDGGAIYNNGGNLSLNTSSVTNNNATNDGGGIVNNPDGTAFIAISTISTNSASNGGGILNEGNLIVQSATVALNSASQNGGGILAMSDVNVAGSIVALNTATSGTDVFGSFLSSNYNLIGTDDAGIFPAQTDDIEEADPLVGPLQNNGGTTLTHALLEGSPAYNTGDPDNLDDDQIGQAVFEGRRDIGAFESQTILLSAEDFQNDNALTLYPNPSRGDTFLELDAAFGTEAQVRVIELASGKVVKDIQISESRTQLSMSGLANGMYVITVTSDAGTATKKLILAQ